MKRLTKQIVTFLMVCCLMLGMTLSVCAASAGSSDATLSKLTVNPGTLTPEFSSDVYEYAVSVDADCDKILIDAKTTDSSAKKVVAGNSGLEAGENKVTITVTAADGSTTGKYTITVTKGDENEDAAAASEAETAEVSETTAADASETTAGAANEADTDASLLPGLKTGTSASAAGAAITTAGKTITTSTPDESKVPEGYISTTITIGDQQVQAWEFPSSMDVENMYLIYGTDDAGKTGFFIYDESENSVISAISGLVNSGEEVSIATEKLQTVEAEYQTKLQDRLYIIFGLAALSAVLFIMMTVAMARRKNAEADYYGDDDFDGDYSEEEYRDGEYPEEDGYSEGDPEDDGYIEGGYIPEDADETDYLPGDYSDENDFEEGYPEEEYSDDFDDPLAGIPEDEVPTELTDDFRVDLPPLEEFEETTLTPPIDATTEIPVADVLPVSEDAFAEEPAVSENPSEEDPTVSGFTDIEEVSADEQIPEVSEIIAAAEIPAAEDDVEEIVSQYEEKAQEPKAPSRKAVIYDRNAQKNTSALTVDEGNEELDADFDLLESILADDKHEGDPAEDSDEKTIVLPTDNPEDKTKKLEDDDDFEFFDL